MQIKEIDSVLLRTFQKKLRLSGLWVLWLLFIAPDSMAQIDTLYIQPISDAKNIGIQTTVNHFRVSFYTATSDKVSFQNYHLGLGLRLKYRKIGLAFSVPVKAFHATTQNKPVFYNLGFTLYPSSYLVQGEFRFIRGFDDLRGLNGALGPVFRSEDRMIVAGLAGIYNFNASRFSLRSAFKMVNRQKRSAGSWLISVPLNFQSFVTDSLALPLANQPPFLLAEYRSIKIGLGGGYGYTKVWGLWSATLVATGGAELRQLQYQHAQTNAIRNQIYLSPRLRILGSIVYNTPHVFGGLTGFYLPGVDVVDGLNTRVENWRLRLVIGYRFF